MGNHPRTPNHQTKPLRRERQTERTSTILRDLQKTTHPFQPGVPFPKGRNNSIVERFASKSHEQNHGCPETHCQPKKAFMGSPHTLRLRKRGGSPLFVAHPTPPPFSSGIVRAWACKIDSESLSVLGTRTRLPSIPSKRAPSERAPGRRCWRPCCRGALPCRWPQPERSGTGRLPWQSGQKKSELFIYR